jgi:hypothetical protein
MYLRLLLHGGIWYSVHYGVYIKVYNIWYFLFSSSVEYTCLMLNKGIQYSVLRVQFYVTFQGIAVIYRKSLSSFDSTIDSEKETLLPGAILYTNTLINIACAANI